MQKDAERIEELEEKVKKLEEGRRGEYSKYKTDEEEVDTNKVEAVGGLSKAQVEAIKKFEKEHREEIICLQPESHYNPGKDGKHYLPNSVPKKLKTMAPSFHRPKVRLVLQWNVVEGTYNILYHQTY